jgi:hypothetical protein
VLLGQRGQQQEMVVGRIGSCYIVLHSRIYIEIEGAHRLFAIASYPTVHVFYFCAVVFFFLSIVSSSHQGVHVNVNEYSSTYILFIIPKIKKRETYRRSPFVFVVSFVTRSLIPYRYTYTLDSLVYLVLYYPG